MIRSVNKWVQILDALNSLTALQHITNLSVLSSTSILPYNWKPKSRKQLQKHTNVENLIRNRRLIIATNVAPLQVITSILFSLFCAISRKHVTGVCSSILFNAYCNLLKLTLRWNQRYISLAVMTVSSVFVSHCRSFHSFC